MRATLVSSDSFNTTPASARVVVVESAAVASTNSNVAHAGNILKRHDSGKNNYSSVARTPRIPPSILTASGTGAYPQE
jgi:hypothetical protein